MRTNRLSNRCIDEDAAASVRKPLRRAVVIGSLWLAAGAWAGGVLLPSDASLPPLALEYHRVSVDVKDVVALTTVKQGFRNTTGRRLEATYVFPLPRDATLNDFVMIVNGKEVHGEILEKGKAARIYEDIVRRMRDPGLLEYLGNRLFRARVYPIPPHGLQKVEVRYSQVIPMDSGVCRYVYPLRTGEKASATLADLTIRVDIRSRQPIKAVYSPTHKIDVARKDDAHVIAGYEGVRERLDQDFELIWTVSDKDFDIHLLAHRPVTKEDGWFMLMLSPPSEHEEKNATPKDVVFVLDTSGSMRERGKIEKARSALKFCVRSLRKSDRFDIIRFSTDVDAVFPDLVPADPEHIDRACRTIDSFHARGGTDICGALLKALDICPGKEEKRPFFIVFLTDGRPTVGVTEPQQILDKIRKRNQTGIRIFTLGVGYDVNALLLDGIAEIARGFTTYIRPEEDIELKVSMLFDKVGAPLLVGPEIDIPGVHVYDVYPKQLPDVFRGSQVLLFGRYKGAGETAIRLTGVTAEGRKTFTYETTFPAREPGNEFIPKLWATRKVGYLLNEIRLHGEKPELRDEVVRLSKEYGIMTPYTSFLIVPDQQVRVAGVRSVRPRPAPPRRPPRPIPMLGMRKKPRRGLEAERASGGAGAGAGGMGMALRPAAGAAPVPDRASASAAVFSASTAGTPLGFTAESGKKAVDASLLVRNLREAKVTDSAPSAAKGVRVVGGKVFVLRGGVWTDTKYQPSFRTVTVRYGSPAWFLIWKKRSDLRKWLKIGDRVVIVLGENLALRVDTDGMEELTPEWKRLLMP